MRWEMKKYKEKQLVGLLFYLLKNITQFGYELNEVGNEKI